MANLTVTIVSNALLTSSSICVRSRNCRNFSSTVCLSVCCSLVDFNRNLIGKMAKQCPAFVLWKQALVSSLRQERSSLGTKIYSRSYPKPPLWAWKYKITWFYWEFTHKCVICLWYWLVLVMPHLRQFRKSNARRLHYCCTIFHKKPISPWTHQGRQLMWSCGSCKVAHALLLVNRALH